MAKAAKLVSHTQIYLDTRALLDNILDVTKDFPRDYKFSIGKELHELGVKLLKEIAAAYINKNKETRIQYLIDFQTDFETVKTLIRIAGERRWIKGLGRHARIVELMDAIGRQSSAWKNSLTKVGQPESGG